MLLSQNEAVLKEWVLSLSGKMQVCLICSMRGSDTNDSPEVKRVTRWLRRQVLKDVNPGSHFMRDIEFIRIKTVMEQDSWKWDRLSIHLYDHMKEALAVVGYFHPDEMVAAKGLEAYMDMCDHMNSKPESKLELIARMKDRPGTLVEAISDPTSNLSTTQSQSK